MELNVLSTDEGNPITLELVKSVLRITDSSEDTFLGHLIEMASDIVEKQARVTLLTKRYCITYEVPGLVGHRGSLSDPDGISEYVNLPYGPIQEIESVYQIDAEGTKSAFANYKVDKNSRLIYWTSSPSKQWVQFNYKAGYGGTKNIPAIYKQAMLAAIEEGYENRSGDIQALVYSVDQVLQGFKEYVVLG